MRNGLCNDISRCKHICSFLLKNKEVTDKIVYGISKYADASLGGAECIAEAFAKAHCGGTLDKDVMNL